MALCYGLASPFLIVIETTVSRSAITRKLAAILIADVVGFSRHMERDEAGAFARLQDIRERVIDPKIAEHGGRVVKTAGDGMLLEFGSADAALRCAIGVQRAMGADNQSKAPDERVEFRIGINLGDIIVDGTDIAGDGVNVAARLEALAEPGGICVSAAVREQVHGSLDVAFDDIGDQQVKNIMRPIRVFAVALNAADAAGHGRAARTGILSVALGRRTLSSRQSVLAVSLLAAVVAAGLLASWWKWSVPRAAEPPAMSVGVLPLVAPVETPATQPLESLTRELSAELARNDVGILIVPVTARQSAQANHDIAELARTIQVRYVLEGEVQTAQGVTAIQLRLVNAASGEQVWNEDVAFKGTGASVDHRRSLRRSMDHLGHRLWDVEIRRAAAEPVGATAMNSVLRALALDTTDKSLDRFRRQEALYEEALRRDPNLVVALLGVYYTLDGQLDVDSTVDRERLIQRMDEVTSRAVNLNRGAPQTWDARSGALMYMGRWDAALEASSKAIQLDPDSANLMASRAWLMSMSGRPAEAIALVTEAISMDPPGHWWTIRVGCEAHLLLGQYDQAIAACEKATGQVGVDFDIAYFLAAAYAHTGSTVRASEETAKILRGSPGFTIAKLRAKQYSTNPEYQRLAETHWYSGLRKAGVPEK
jgi:class 3 adenylate cyclase/tetratricopeptide (TPR) repeat protein